jgi:hypothetical protein
MTGQRGHVARMAVTIVAMLGTYTLGARENTKRPVTVGRTGKQLPVWVTAGVKALLKEVPTLATCPAGYTVTAQDIVFVNRYRDLEPVLSLSQYEFTAYRNVPAFLIGHHFPLFLVGESPDVGFIQLLIRNGMADQAILLAKALLAHEVMHAWFDPAQGKSDKERAHLTVEESERSHEVAAYELQLVILKRDLAAGNYASMYARLNTGTIDLTIAIEERLRALRAGEPMQKFHLLGTPLPTRPVEEIPQFPGPGVR